MIYDKFAPTVKARTDLKDAITVATRPMVMHGTLTRAPQARPPANVCGHLK